MRLELTNTCRRPARTIAVAGLCLGLAAWPARRASAEPVAPAAAAAAQPANLTRQLGPGVRFTRDVRQVPRPLAMAIVEIDIKQPGLEFVVTPGDASGGRELRAMTTSRFLTTNKLRVAINGGFFAPFRSAGDGGYYPHAGDAVDVHGLCASRGVVYSQDEENYSSLNISADGNMSIIDDPTKAYQAISGRRLELDPRKPSADAAIHPRTAVGLNHRAHKLILLVVDGRQPGYSEGLTLAELAAVLAGLGAQEALNLDGGGSATMASAEVGGTVTLLNRPIHQGVPGRERPVANHFGLRWK